MVILQLNYKRNVLSFVHPEDNEISSTITSKFLINVVSDAQFSPKNYIKRKEIQRRTYSSAVSFLSVFSSGRVVSAAVTAGFAAV